jgi:hypothetical protein
VINVYSNDGRVCSFCEKEIESNEVKGRSDKSICKICSYKYKINSYGFSEAAVTNSSCYYFNNLYGQKANYVSSIIISSATSRLKVTRTQTSSL